MNEIEKYIVPTGDPFADIGGYAIEEFAKRYPNENIMGLISKVTDIYVDKWDAKINPFFLNSKITQPAFKADKKKEETAKYFQSLLDKTATHTFGFCRITGEKTELYPAGRDNSILSGSGTFVNFHHTFEPGIMLSKEAIIRFHFVPIACELLQGRIAVIQSSDNELTRFFTQDKVSKNLSNIGANISEGILKSDCRSPGTALFRFIDKAVADKKAQKSSSSLTLYHFTNFGATPEVKIYLIPSILFEFYNFTQNSKYKSQWNRFVSSYYFNNKEYKGAKFNPETNEIEWATKKEEQKIGEKDYQFWSNRIYTKLINDQSILREIRLWCIEKQFDFEIVKTYQVGIRNMKIETVNKIDQMADLIFKMNDADQIKKVIKTLNSAKSGYNLRRFIIRDVVSKNYEKNPEDEPIVTVEEYTKYLFPDTSSWSEMRDVLLIAIYQRLHEQKLSIEIEDESSDEEGFETEEE
ncbi:type I-B CRISPR-associated protein Cas8b1/Cst1 [Methanolapillus ohkumae]|uniref:Type I-B CRISPR-associated protein Cas8b1/Cst1 n=1 Tax=Methanolapillus ohkumae TaxID=3028298 RepID=A0AA96ZW94_9EURY|nr:hypothetical protein MsAm2_00910 [Methanosarcinaceae archaeon Am2]